MRLLRLVMLMVLALLLMPAVSVTAQDDKFNKQKVINDINQAFSKADSLFQAAGYTHSADKASKAWDAAIEAYQAALDLVRANKTLDAFAQDPELTQMRTFEFRGLSGLGRSNFGKVDYQQDDLSRTFSLGQVDGKDITEDDLKPSIQYLLDALDIAKQLPDKLQGKEWVYMTLAWIYQYSAYEVYDVSGGGFSSRTLANSDKLLDVSEDYYKLAGDLFNANGNATYESAAYYGRANSVRRFLGLTARDQDGVYWYKTTIDYYRRGQRYMGAFGGFSYAVCEAPFLFANRLANNTIQDTDTKIDNVLRETVDTRYYYCTNQEFWRGIARAQLAIRNNDEQNAKDALSEMTRSFGPLWKRYFASLPKADTLYAYYYLGRLYSMTGQPLQALDNLLRADGLPYSDADEKSPYGLEWANTQAQMENTWLIGRNQIIVGQLNDGLDRLLSLERKPNFETNIIFPDVMGDISDVYQKLGQYELSIDPLKNRLSYYDHALKAAQAVVPTPTPIPAATLTKPQVTATAVAAAKAGPTDQEKLIAQYQLGKVDTLIRLSTPLAILGRTEEALTGLQQASDLAATLTDPQPLANSLLRIGQVYSQLGLDDNALTNYNKAADIAEKAVPRLVQIDGQALFGVGQIQLTHGQIKDAGITLNKANQSAAQAHDNDTQTRILLALGDLALTGDKPDPRTAEQQYHLAVDSASRATDPRLSVDTQMALAGLQVKTNPLTGQLAYYRALVNANAIDYREAIAKIDGHLAKIKQTLNQPAAADIAYQNAIDTVERTQHGFKSESLTAQFAANFAWIYADYIKSLADQKRYEEAFDVAERARARAFLDQLAIGPVDLHKGASADLLQKERALQARIDALLKLLNNAPPTDKAQVTRIRADLQTAQSDYAALFARMQATDPAIVSLTSVDAASIKDVQGVLDDDSTVVSYYTTDTEAYAFIITKNSFDLVVLTTNQSKLNTAVKQFRADEKQAAGLDSISADVVAPIIDKLKTKHLIIVPHNVLHYVPFAALPVSNEKLLGEQFTISYVPSASTLLRLPKKPSTAGALLALGNPVAEGFKPLPFAEDEVKQVASIAKGEVYTGADAKKSIVLSKASDAGVLYIAAHGTYNQRNPLFSALHLSEGDGQNGTLNAYNIYSLDLTQHTDLVVLSACETAVGSLSAGDEFTGLNRSFLYAGAPTVIASLWSVDDKATAILMTSFFKARAVGKSNAEALQIAQAEVRAFKDDSGKTPFTSPYYWAAFIITGRD